MVLEMLRLGKSIQPNSGTEFCLSKTLIPMQVMDAAPTGVMHPKVGFD